MSVDLVLQETLAQFLGFAHLRLNSNHFPGEKGVLQRKSSYFALFVQTGRTGSGVLAGCGRRWCTSLLHMIQSKIKTCLATHQCLNHQAGWGSQDGKTGRCRNDYRDILVPRLSTGWDMAHIAIFPGCFQAMECQVRKFWLWGSVFMSCFGLSWST